MRVVDACLFAGESKMLELRLRTLRGTVDRSVVVACTYTHQGVPLTDDERNEIVVAYMRAVSAARVGGTASFYWVIPSMVIDRGQGTYFYRPEDERGPAGSKWFQHIEKQHRDGIDLALVDLDLGPADVVLMSDVDEIPAPDAVHRVCEVLADQTKHKARPPWYTLAQRMHSGSMNWLHPQQPWFGTCATLYRDLRPQMHRDARTTIGTGRQFCEVIDQGGWHFSWFGTDDDRARKLSTFSHAELVGRYDPADGRRSGYHSNGEKLIRAESEASDSMDWPDPLREMETPDCWYDPIPPQLQ